MSGKSVYHIRSRRGTLRMLDESYFSREITAICEDYIACEKEKKEEFSSCLVKLLNNVYELGYTKGKMDEADDLISSISPLVTKLQDFKVIAQLKMMDYKSPLNF